MLAQCAQTPFESSVVVVRIIVLHVLRIVLIDTVVGEVAILSCVCVEDLVVGVLLGSEPGEAFSVDVDPQRVERGDDHVKS